MILLRVHSRFRRLTLVTIDGRMVFFLASFAISLANVLIVAILIIIYLINRRGYKAKPLPRSVFSISDTENWTLSLLMSRRFARYK